MNVHLNNALRELQINVAQLAALVQERVGLALQAFLERDDKLAAKVRIGDAEIDKREVDIEEECLKILALYQPVAHDLRFVVTVLKVNNDLERIADLAVHIAERAAFVTNYKNIEFPVDFRVMGGCVQEMLSSAVLAMSTHDAKLAREVCGSEGTINKYHVENYDKIEQEIAKRPEHTKFFIQVLSISRYLERIADQATNISEDVIYLEEGSIVRHHFSTPRG